MNLRWVAPIWHVSGTLPLRPGLGRDDALDRLDPLFRQPGTTRERGGDTLTFRKKDQAAQDKMSVFDSGVLRIEQGATGAVLRYRLASRALLFCFMLPLLFLGFAVLTIGLNQLHGEPTGAEKAAAAARKAAAEKKPEVPMNWLDKALGAPAPEKRKKDGEKKKEEEENKNPTPTSAYVFAGIFALLYAVGRMLEARLVRSLFSKALLDA